MITDQSVRERQMADRPEEVLAPMSPEKRETASGRRGRRRERKTWKRPIRISRLPTFGLSGFDFTFDQIPAIFTGYTAGSEDSSSSEMSDASVSYSQPAGSSDENEEIKQVRSSAVKRRASFKRMKSISRIPSMKLRRQLTRKFSGGTETRQRLKKAGSIKRSKSLLRRKLHSKDDQSSRGLSVEAAGLSHPRYSRPTSSSASKKVVQTQKNPKPNSGSTAKRLFGGCLTRTSSLRPSRKLTKMVSMRSSRKKNRGISPLHDSSLLRATCSSALRDSKFVDDVSDKKVCRYAYCSLHGLHHHTDDVNFPSLRRFVSMRRRLLKSQKSIKRSSILLKRSFSRKRGSGILQVAGGRDNADKESGQVDVDGDGELNQDNCEVDFSCSENRIYGNDSESNRRSPETHDLATIDVNENRDESSGLAFGTNATTRVVTARKRWGDLQTPREGSEATEIDAPKTLKLWRLIYQHMLTGLGHEIGTSGAMKDGETEGFNSEGAGSCQDGPGVVQDGNAWADSQKTEHERSNAVELVKQAFNEVLSEIPDYTSDDKSTTGNQTLDHEHLKEEKDQGLEESISASCDSGRPTIAGDTAVSGVASASNMGEDSNRRVPKNWSYLKKIILLKRFVKSLENLRNFDQRGRKNLSEEPKPEVVETMRLRDQSVGERKNEREWMLDYALRQVISTLAPSQKRKVELLVQAFETVFPTDNLKTHLEGRPEQNDPECTSSRLMKSGEAERQSMSLETRLRENNDEATDILVTEDPVQGHERPDSVCCDNGLDSDRSHGRGHTGIGVASGVPAVFSGPTLDEPIESIVDGSLCDSLTVTEGLDGSGSCTEEEKEGNSERGTQAERQNLIKWRNLIYKHMIMVLSAKDESKPEAKKEDHVEDTGQLGSTDQLIKFKFSPGTTQISGMEEDVGAADSSICAVKLVQQAFEKILLEIPDQSSDEQTVSAVSSYDKGTIAEEKEDLRCQDGVKGWNSLKKVILLKRFVKSLEKVRNLKPRKPRYLPIEPEMEAEKVHLRHRLTEHKKNAEELMLDYTLRQVISTLALSQRRKVALLVQAFDAVLDGGEQNLRLQDDEIRPDSVTSVSCDHGTPKHFRVNYIIQNNGETTKEDSMPHSLEGTNISKVNSKPDKKSDCDFNIEDPDKFLRAQALPRDLKEEEAHSVVSESNLVANCTSDIIRRIVMEKEKDAKVWNLIYEHMVRVSKRENMEGEPIALVEKDENHDEVHLKIKTKSSGTVKLVREALEKILSEIPDHSSDGQPVGSDIITDQELSERHCEVSGAAVATELHPDDEARDITFKQKLEPKPDHKSHKKSLKGWSNLKKVILLRRFVNDLSSLTKLSPRNPPYLHSESDPEAEKIHLKQYSSEGRKSSEEWMLDYALRQVISTLEPSQKRKVALLAQAFETISLQETWGCWSPNSATSPVISRRSSTSSLFQIENKAFSEIREARSSEKAGDSGLPEASIQIAHPMNELAQRGSGYYKQDGPIMSFQVQQRDMDDKESPFVPCNQTDNAGCCLEDDGETSTQKSRNLQEDSEETKFNVSTTGGSDDNLEKQQCMSLWRLLCKQMELGVTENERSQPLLEETSKEEENNDDTDLENQSSDSQKMEVYQCEAAKLLGEAIDEIPLPGTKDDDDLRDDQLDNGNTIPDQKLLTAQEDSKAEQEIKAEQMPNKRNGWSSIKRVIILKRFVKALEKVRRFNPREPRFLPLKPDAEAEKVNLRHQETQNKKSGEEWMLDYALQDVVTKLTPARKRKVQLLVQAFETVIPATGN